MEDAGLKKRKVLADEAFMVKINDVWLCHFCKRDCHKGHVMLTFTEQKPHMTHRVMWCIECDNRIRTRRGLPLRFVDHENLGSGAAINRWRKQNAGKKERSRRVYNTRNKRALLPADKSDIS